MFVGLATFAIGLITVSFTSGQPVPWYTRSEITAVLSANEDFRTHENPTTANLGVSLPDDGSTGWLWMLLAMVPTSVGFGILQTSINSMITKCVSQGDLGGTLGISSALLGSADAAEPIFGGTLFGAFSAGMPFLVFGLIMAVLLFGSLRMIKLIRPAAQTVEVA